MGIKNLNKLLKNRCPEVFEEIHLSEYAYKKIAIDLTLFLCKFKSIQGDNWLSAFINLVVSLRRNEIHCVFIYDSGSPIEKAGEKEDRQENREKMKKRINEIEESLQIYYKTGEIKDILMELNNKEKKKLSPQKRVMKNEEEFDIKIVEEKFKKMQNYIWTITKEDFDLTKQLFDILCIPYYDSPMEAECMCADLAKTGRVSAALSEDTDVLAYLSPVFLTKINTSNDTCVRIEIKNILEALDITKEQFLDLCILHGCDYNKNIPRIGGETAYKYLKKYGSIEGIKENLKIDISILNHVRTRELFTNYEQHKIENIPYCGYPDMKKLEKFLLKNNINYKIETLKKHFVHTFLVIKEDGDEDIVEDAEEEKVEEEVVEEEVVEDVTFKKANKQDESDLELEEEIEIDEDV